MSKERIQVVLDIAADVGKIEGSLSSLRGSLANIQLPKGIGRELENRMSKLSDEIKNFQNLASKAGNSFEGAKQIDASYKKIVEYARKVENSFSAIKDEAKIDASKLFPKDVLDRIEKAENAMADYYKAIEKGNDSLKEQRKNLKDIETALDKNKKKQGELLAKQSGKKASRNEIVKEQTKIKADKTIDLNKEQKSLELLNKRKITLEAEKTAVDNLIKKKEALEKAEKIYSSRKAQYGAKDSKAKGEKINFDAAKKAYSEAEAAAKQYGDTVRSISDIEIDQSKTAADIKNTETAIKGLGKEIENADAKIKKADNAYDNLTKELKENEAASESFKQQITNLKTEIEKTENTAKAEGLKTLAKTLSEIGIKVDPTVNSLEDIQNTINNLKPEAIQNISSALEKAGVNIEDLGVSLEKVGDKNKAFQEGAKGAKQMNDQMEQLKGQVQQFFSLTNSVMLFRRGVQQAIETVKELDAAMTETAVVTDFSVGDMWEALPRYTQTANDLGTTTLGAYETMTLFYQQGLETNEVFEVGTETMKMARIAGLDYADATNLMTAALRGFNMELNETSATRINDVYSELAAITAADTNEIATAMTKTASIANSANMEFETTAALLSQIIETTREPAETAGTALKTIIARFTEMKKSSSEIINVDGEEVNVNKVEAALKSAGVALRDVNGEFRDLDDVFLELSSKWNGLDIMTQRYVATMAAGSRQQSRFIAMMQDYDRTIELVDAAYNSSGASQKQFEKTQDSLESKINRLKNAWNEFLMGISNSKIIKAGVDALTGLLNVVNKLTGKSGLLKLGVAIGALKGGSVIFNKLFQSLAPLGKQIENKGADIGVGLLKGLTQRLSNFTLGKGFVLDVDIGEKGLSGLSNKINIIKQDYSSLMEVIKTPVIRDDAILMFEKIDDKIVATSMTAKGMTSQLDGDLSQIAMQSLAASEGVEEIGEDFIKTGISGKTALDLIQKEYLETIALAEALDKANDGEVVEFNGDVIQGKFIASEFSRQHWKGRGDTLGKDVKTLESGGTTTLQTFRNLLPVLGKVGIALAAIAAVAGVIWSVWYNSAAQKAKRQFESAVETSENFQKRLEEVNNSVKELESSWESLTQQEEALNGLTKGTIEWNKALNDYNATVLEVIKNNKELSFSVDSSGRFVIDENDYNDYLFKLQEEQKNAQLNSLMASNFAEYAEYSANLEQLKAAEVVTKPYERGEVSASGLSAALYLNEKKKESEALASLGLTEGYTQEELNNLKNKQIIEYEGRQKSAYLSYLTNSYNEKVMDAAASLASNASTMLIDREKIKSDLGVTDDWTKNGISRFDQESIKDWAEYAGYDYINGKVYDKEGQEIEIKWSGEGSEDGKITNEQIAQELIMYRTNEAGKSRAKDIADVLSKVGGEVSSIYSGDWGNVDEIVLNGLLAENKDSLNYVAQNLAGEYKNTNIGDLDTTKDSQMISFLESATEKTYDELKAEYDGETISAIISENLSTYADKIQEVIDEQKAAFKVTTDDGYAEQIVEKYNATIEEMSLKEIDFLSDLKIGLNEAFDEEQAVAFFSAIKDSYVQLKQSGLTEEDLADYRDAWNQVDFNSPLNSMKNLNKTIEEGSESASNFAQSVKGILSETFLSSASQFKEVLNAQDFSEVNQELTKIYQNEGKITFDNIKEAAEESSTLNLMLEEGTISATGFAKAMELVAEGTFDVTQMTSEFIDALTAANALMDTMDQAHLWATEYDFGKDYSEIGKSYADASEAAQALAAGGAWGNPQLDEYMNFLIGENEWQQALETYDGDAKKAYQSKAKQVKASQGTLLGRWQYTIKDDDTNKNQLAASIGSQGLTFDLTNIKSTDDLVENIYKNTSATEEEARALVADAANYSSQLSKQLERLDKINAINKLLNKKKPNANGEYTITDAEMEALGIDEKFVKSLKTADKKSVKVWNKEERQKVTSNTSNAMAEEVKSKFEKENNGVVEGTFKITKLDTDETVNKTLEEIKNLDLTAENISVPEETRNELQTIFNAKVDEGVTNGLTLDEAKQAAITGLGTVLGTTNANFLAAGLVSGYQDERGVYAAAAAGAQQGAQLYQAIYTSIVTAIADAFAAYSGLDLGISYATSGKKTLLSDTRVITAGDTSYTKEQWEAAFGTDFDEAFKNAGKINNVATIKNNAGSTAAANANAIFTTEKVLANTYGWTPEQIDRVTEQITSGAWDSTELENIVLPDGTTVADIYDDAGRVGTNTSSGSGGSKDKDDKINYTNPTLENINEKLENLERRREKGEIDALDYENEKRGLLGLKQGILQADLDKALANSQYKKYFGYDKETDSILLNEVEFNKLNNEKKDAVMEEYERIKGINDELNEIEDEIGEYAANANTVDAINAALEAIERKYENKDLNAIEYTRERDALLSKKAIILQATLDDELANNTEKRFFYYDEVLDAVLLNEEEFNKLSEDRQEEVRKEYEKIKSINDELNEIEDTLKDMEFRSPEDRRQYQLGEAMNWNAQGDLDSINRKRDELGRYDELIGKLPSEMQGPLTLMTGGMNMLYEAEESQVLRRQEEALRMELEAQERNAQFLDNGINDPNEAIYYYDPTTQSYKIHEDRFAKLEKQEQRDAVMEEIEKMKGYTDAINEVQTQRSGGIFQKPFYIAEKSAKAMQKAFKNTGNTAKDVKDAFNDLEKALGLSETALDKFEGGLTEAIDQSGLKDKEIKGLGLLSDEQFNKLNNSKLGGFMGDNTKAFAQMLFGEGSTNGMDFANTGLGALSEMFGFTGDLMNFDMMGMGLDMLNTGKGMIEQGMQMVEKIIGYIAQAVQVVVDAWTNREDYLYNFLQIIEKRLRDYEKLQREQNQIEKGRYASVDDIKKNWDAQWKSLQTQLEEQTERLETRQKELERSRWNPFSLISGWDPSTDTLYENRTVKFAWDLFIGFGSMAPMGIGSFFGSLNQLYEDYDKRVQNSYEDRLAAEQAILDIEDQRLELVKAGSEQATEFEQRVMDAMVQKEQEQIEELTRLNDTISEANSKLIETLRSNLEKMRQERENEKTEEELSEKERRLAYLRQDTSGANMMEIKKLEEQLEEGHESYTDKLIDQKISELEEQNDKAAEQRQKQIDLLQGQLDYAEKYGLYWDKIYGMLYTFDENGNAVLNPDNFDLDGNIRKNSELDKLLGTFSDRIGMSTWSAILDAEELDYLGKYYGAFIEYNGVTGDWKNAWALKDPGAADPNYAYPEQEIPDGLWGALYRLEIALKKNSIHNNPDLINRGGRLEESFKNFFGKLFGNEEWANYEYEPTSAAHVQSTFFAGMKEDLDGIKAWFSGGTTNISKNAKNLSINSGGTQNYGDTNVNNHFNIGSVGESISLDDMANRVANIFKDMFSTGNNVLRNGH